MPEIDSETRVKLLRLASAAPAVPLTAIDVNSTFCSAVRLARLGSVPAI